MKSTLDWNPITQWFATVTNGETRLILNLTATKQGWVLLALSMPAQTSPDVLTAAGEVFDQHSHQVVGKWRSERSAKRAATTYARQWIKKNPAPPACRCGEIDAR